MKIKIREAVVLRVASSIRNYCGVIAVVALAAFVVPAPAKAATGVNEQVAYQGRLLDSTGAVVPDGSYNLEFKIYQDGTGCVASGTSPCGGTLKWTETRTTTDRVTVRNGYFSVMLGEVTAFGTSVDWNQSVLWLSVNVGGTAVSPVWDGEMLPFRRAGAAAYALNAKKVGGLDTTQLVQLAQGSVQGDASLNSSIFINKTGASGNILQLQKNGVDSLTLSNAGLLTLAGGLTVNNSVLFQNAANSTTALNVKNQTSNNIFTVDTSNGRLGVNLGGTAVPTLSAGGIEVKGSLQLTGGLADADTYVTPLGASVSSRINIVNYDLPAFGQVFAFGVTSTSNSTSRGLTVSDARAGAHQPTIAVLSPDENQVGGLSWDGSNTGLLVKNTSATGTIGLSINNVTTLSATTAGIDVTGVYKIGGVSGAVTTCSGGQFLQNQVVSGGITTGGTCAVAGGGTATLQSSYDNHVAGTDTTIALTSADDSFVVQNPAAGGTDSAFTMLVEQLNTGAVDGLRIASAGTGLLLKVTDTTTTAADVFTIANEGAATFKNRTDSTAAFSIQTAGSASMFKVDTQNSRLYVGDPTPDTSGVQLVLDNKNNAGDPSSPIDGAMYYNSDSDNFRCRHNGLWQDCDFASLRAEWVLRDDFANTSVTSLSIGTEGWLFASIGTGGTIAKTNVGTDASDQDRFGVLQMSSPATVTTGVHLRLDPAGMAGVPSNMVVEFALAPVNAAAAAGLQQVERVGLHNSSTASAPTNGIYFQYNTTTTAANWFRCTQATCVDTGIARTLTANQYQRFRIQTNSTGTAVEFFINEVSGGIASTNLPGATASYGPAINVSTVDATIRQWKIDYFQIKRNLTTLR